MISSVSTVVYYSCTRALATRHTGTYPRIASCIPTGYWRDVPAAEVLSALCGLQILRTSAGPHSHRSTAPHRGYLYIPHSALYSYSLLRIAANGLAAPCASRPCWLVLYPLRIMRCMQDTVGMHRRLTTS